MPWIWHYGQYGCFWHQVWTDVKLGTAQVYCSLANQLIFVVSPSKRTHFCSNWRQLTPLFSLFKTNQRIEILQGGTWIAAPSSSYAIANTRRAREIFFFWKNGWGWSYLTCMDSFIWTWIPHLKLEWPRGSNDLDLVLEVWVLTHKSI